MPSHLSRRVNRCRLIIYINNTNSDGLHVKNTNEDEFY